MRQCNSKWLNTKGARLGERRPGQEKARAIDDRDMPLVLNAGKKLLGRW